jgi:hypothetical protein
MGFYTAVSGDNSDLIKEVSDLYIKDGEVVADVTYGRGVFWNKVDTGRFKFLKSDILTVEPPIDFRDLPYENEFLDHFVFDPPYMHTPGRPMVDERYKNSATTKKMYHKDIMEELYYKGMREGFRTLKFDGFAYVKCQDEIESGFQRWSHIEIYDIATSLGFYGKDFFVLKPPSNPGIQYKKQKHARKNHSYLWVFQKIATDKYEKLKERKIISDYKNFHLTNNI